MKTRGPNPSQATSISSSPTWTRASTFNDAHDDTADEQAPGSMHPSPALPTSSPNLFSPPSLVSPPPAPVTPPAPTRHATSTPPPESPEQFDDTAIDKDDRSIRMASSSPLSVSVALNENGGPIPTTVEEQLSEIRCLRMMNASLEREIARSNAKANAMTRALSLEDGKTGSQKAKTTRGASKKGPRRVGAALMAKAQFAAKRRQKARVAKTKVDDAAREA